MDMELYETLQILRFRMFIVQCWTICRRCIALLAGSNTFLLYLHGGLSKQCTVVMVGQFNAIVTSGPMVDIAGSIR